MTAIDPPKAIIAKTNPNLPVFPFGTSAAEIMQIAPKNLKWIKVGYKTKLRHTEYIVTQMNNVPGEPRYIKSIKRKGPNFIRQTYFFDEHGLTSVWEKAKVGDKKVPVHYQVNSRKDGLRVVMGPPDLLNKIFPEEKLTELFNKTNSLRYTDTDGDGDADLLEIIDRSIPHIKERRLPDGQVSMRYPLKEPSKQRPILRCGTK